MKKFSYLAAAVVLMFSSCGVALNQDAGTTATNTTGNILGGILGAATDGNTLGIILGNVLGTNKVSASGLVGTWKYSQPGCAFTSENALAQAGGEVAATEIKNKLKSQYSKLGIKSSNTYIQFNSDKTFTAKIDGTPWSGTYTFNESKQQVVMKGLLLNLTGYTKQNTNGISILFESSKLLTLIQTISAASGNSTLSTIGSISKNYSGLRMGFDMTK